MRQVNDTDVDIDAEAMPNRTAGTCDRCGADEYRASRSGKCFTASSNEIAPSPPPPPPLLLLLFLGRLSVGR